MWRATFVLLIALAPELSAQPSSEPPATDLATGVRQFDGGDLEGALETLTSVVRALEADAARSAELAEAHLYLGAVYALQDQEKAARASFREALRLNPALSVPADRFPPRVVRLVDEQRPTARPLPTPSVVPPAPPSSAQPTWPGLPFIGVQLAELTPGVRAGLGLPDLGGGVLVKSIDDGTPAAAAGLRVDDVIRKLDGTILPKPSALASEVSKRKVGDRLALEVWRLGKPLDMLVTVADRVAFLSSQCEQGRADRCYQLGALYESNASSFFSGGPQKDVARAAALFKKACDGGFMSGCDHLGHLYRKGEGVPRDLETALALFKRTCDAGNSLGCMSLGIAHLRGEGLPQDTELAISLYVKGLGEAQGSLRIGYFLRDGKTWGGEVVPQDDKRAVELFRRSCELNEPDGCAALGFMYHEGRGVPADHARSFALYKQACDAGSLNGCNNLAMQYADGDAVPRDPVRAAALLGQACERGYVLSCLHLGGLYWSGEGVEKNPGRARELYQKACTAGVKVACDRLAKLPQ